jgi:hypothetical protein
MYRIIQNLWNRLFSTSTPSNVNEQKAYSFILNFWGSIYSKTWFGNVNEKDGWGSIYPFNADGSWLTVDETITTVDSIYITSDQTIY